MRAMSWFAPLAKVVEPVAAILQQVAVNSAH
jgi:hypothetical protein